MLHVSLYIKMITKLSNIFSIEIWLRTMLDVSLYYRMICHIYLQPNIISRWCDHRIMCAKPYHFLHYNPPLSIVSLYISSFVEFEIKKKCWKLHLIVDYNYASYVPLYCLCDSTILEIHTLIFNICMLYKKTLLFIRKLHWSLLFYSVVFSFPVSSQSICIIDSIFTACCSITDITHIKSTNIKIFVVHF